MWFGTQDGLNRWDGVEFKYFLSGRQINDIKATNDGHILVGTDRGGVVVNPLSESIIHEFNEEVSVNQILHLSSGVTWIASNRGLFKYAGTHASEKKALYMSGKSVTAILKVPESDTLWIGYESGEVSYFNTKTYVNDSVNRMPSSSKVTAIHFDHNRNIIVGTQSDGIFVYSRQAGRFVVKDKIPVRRRELKVSCITNLGNKELLFGCKYGITTKDQKGGVLSKSYNTVDGFSEQEVYTPISLSEYLSTRSVVFSILFDGTESLLWIGTDKGVLKGQVRSHYFEGVTATKGEGRNEGLTDKHVWSIAEDDKKRKWVVTENGLNICPTPVKDPGKFKHFYEASNPSYTLESSQILSLEYDSFRKTMWIGARKSGLHRARWNEKRQNLEATVVQGFSTKGSTDIRVIQLSNEVLWIGTSTKGLYRYNILADKVVEHWGPKDFDSSLKEIHVYCIHVDANNPDKIWIGTIGNGLYEFDLLKDHRPKKIRTYKNDFFGEKVTSITQSTDPDVLWVSFYGTGLFELDKMRKELTKSNFAKGAIYEVIEHNGLWLSTNHGIYYYDDKIPFYKRYDKKDGILGMEFNGGASLFSKSSNQIFFGGTNGITYFNPDSILNESRVGEPKLFVIPLQSKELALMQGDTLRCNYKQQEVLFELASPVHSRTERIAYRYRFSENDTTLSNADWEKVKTNNNLFFSVRPGNFYSIEIQAGYKGFSWRNNQFIKSKKFHIQVDETPIFQNKYYVVAIIILLLLFWSHRFYRRRIILRIKQDLDEIAKNLAACHDDKEIANAVNGALVEKLRFDFSIFIGVNALNDSKSIVALKEQQNLNKEHWSILDQGFRNNLAQSPKLQEVVDERKSLIIKGNRTKTYLDDGQFHERQRKFDRYLVPLIWVSDQEMSADEDFNTRVAQKVIGIVCIGYRAGKLKYPVGNKMRQKLVSDFINYVHLSYDNVVKRQLGEERDTILNRQINPEGMKVPRHTAYLSAVLKEIRKKMKCDATSTKFLSFKNELVPFESLVYPNTLFVDQKKNEETLDEWELDVINSSRIQLSPYKVLSEELSTPFRSILLVPLMHKGVLFGVMYFYSYTKDFFDYFKSKFIADLIPAALVEFQKKKLAFKIEEIVDPLSPDSKEIEVWKNAVKKLKQFFLRVQVDVWRNLDSEIEELDLQRDNEEFTEINSRNFFDSKSWLDPILALKKEKAIDIIDDFSALERGTRAYGKLYSNRKSRFSSLILIEVNHPQLNVGAIGLWSKQPISQLLDEDYAFIRALSSKLALSVKSARLKEKIEKEHNSKLIMAQQMNPGRMALLLSHDVKHAMQHLTLLIEILIEDWPEAKRYSEIGKALEENIHFNANSLKSLFRAIAKVGSGQEVKLRPIDFRETLKTIGTAFGISMSQKRIDLKIEGLKDIPEKVWIDESKFSLVLMNLFTNSIHALRETSHTNREIKINLYVTNGGKYLKINWRDTGIGITQENLKKVFVEEFTTKGPDGSGFGLKIADKIIREYHNGQREVRSNFGSWTLFTIQIPIKPLKSNTK